MTMHEYDSETNPSPTQVEPTTARSDRWVEPTDPSTSAGASDLPPASTVSADQWSTTATNSGRAAQDPESTTLAPESSGGLGSVPQVGTESPNGTSLFADVELTELRTRWNDVQAGFVDDPQDCVQKADGLVSAVVKQLTSGFTEARSRLEQQWSRGEQASTEDLRVALKRYREFFDRLLAV
jgi:hypothetical protein